MVSASLLTHLASSIAAGTGLIHSVLAGSSKGQPDQLNDRHFSISLQSHNSRGLRSRVAFWMEETVTIDYVFSINMRDQVNSQIEAMKVEEDIIALMLDHSLFPGVAVNFLGVERAVNSTREYFITSLTFNISYAYSI